MNDFFSRVRLGRAAIAACLVVFTVSLSATADPVGEWNMKLDLNGRAIEAKMDLTKGDDGALGGTWYGRQGESVLKDVKLDGDKLTFVRNVDYQGQTFDLTFSGSVDGDAITGTFDSPMGAIQANGARVVVAAAAPPAGLGDLAGEWAWVSDSQLGVIESTFTVFEDGRATLGSPEVSAEATNVVLDGSNLSYDITVDVEGQALDLQFKGTVEGDNIKGQFHMQDVGPVAEVTATRGPAGPSLADLAGEWAWVSDSQLGVIESTFTVSEDGRATLGAEGVTAEATNVVLDGSNLSYDITVDVEGQALDLQFKGTVDGDNIKGQFHMQDVGPVAEVTATRGGGLDLSPLVGDWKWVSDSQLGVLESTFSVTDAGVVTLGNADVKAEATEVKFDGTNLSYNVTVDVEGQVFDLQFIGKVEGDKITGQFHMQDVGPVAEVTATRGGGADNLAGDWSITAETPLGTLEHTLAVNGDGSTAYVSDGETTPLRDLTVDGEHLEFKVLVHAGGAEYDVEFVGQIDGHVFNGNFYLDGGDVGTVVGEKAAKPVPNPGAIVGEWTVDTISQIGEQTHTMWFNADGTATYKSDNETATIPSYTVDGDVVHFAATIQGFDIVFNGTLGDGALKGAFTMGGQEVATLVGKKIQ